MFIQAMQAFYPVCCQHFFTKILSTWFKSPKIVCKCIVLNGAMLKKNPNMPNLHIIISNKSEDQKS